MGHIENQIMKLASSDRFQKQCNEQMKTKKNFGKESGHIGTEDLAKKYAGRIEELLRNEITGLVSDTTGEAFLDCIQTDVYFESGHGWIIDVNFDDKSVIRDSLSINNESVYLPALINNMWSNSPLGKVYGYNRHGNYVTASDKYMNGSFKGFIDSAIQQFKNETGDKLIIEINKRYDNGTL